MAAANCRAVRHDPFAARFAAPNSPAQRLTPTANSPDVPNTWQSQVSPPKRQKTSQRTMFCNFLHFFAANYKTHPAQCGCVMNDVSFVYTREA
ncbi:hypothetical protein [Paraburkholderia sp. CI3]|uniref:hypothetical protein n=1 Tax=Paraburkholderia sp. CI3 TaxID=2991060 RepID=UPI003D1EC2B8